MLKREDNPSARSFKSYKSHKSILTDKGYAIDDVKEFEVCFPELCGQFGLEREVHVKKEFKEDDYFKHLQASEAGKRRRTVVGLHSPRDIIAKAASPVAETKETTTTGTNTAEPTLDVDAIILAAFYDGFNRLVEIFIYKVNEVPRELIKILTIVARYYMDLKRFKMQFCRKVRGATIFEISKLLNVSSITEVDLDGCYCRAGNYGILFESGRITNVSLSKCCINDEVCEIIASKIGMKGSAEKSLYSLNLSSNSITDVGAISLANSLRTNRKLRYLNLAANGITDTGASHILDTLKEFPLTREENIQKCKRYMEYERKRLIYFWKFLRERQSDESSKSVKANMKRKSTAINKNKMGSLKYKDTKKDLMGRNHSAKSLAEPVNRSQRDLLSRSSRSPSHRALTTYEDLINKAQIKAGEMMGPFQDPFQSTQIRIREGKCYSKGNISLCYLNLAFNHLGYLSILKLLDVLKYQSETKSMGQVGLVRVLIQGNNMPIYCQEYIKVDEFLIKSMKASGGRAFADYNPRSKSIASPVVPFQAHSKRK